MRLGWGGGVPSWPRDGEHGLALGMTGFWLEMKAWARVWGPRHGHTESAPNPEILFPPECDPDLCEAVQAAPSCRQDQILIVWAAWGLVLHLPTSVVGERALRWQQAHPITATTSLTPASRGGWEARVGDLRVEGTQGEA